MNVLMQSLRDGYGLDARQSTLTCMPQDLATE